MFAPIILLALGQSVLSGGGVTSVITGTVSAGGASFVAEAVGTEPSPYPNHTSVGYGASPYNSGEPCAAYWKVIATINRAVGSGDVSQKLTVSLDGSIPSSTPPTSITFEVQEEDDSYAQDETSDDISVATTSSTDASAMGPDGTMNDDSGVLAYEDSIPASAWIVGYTGTGYVSVVSVNLFTDTLTAGCDSSSSLPSSISTAYAYVDYVITSLTAP